MKFHSIGNRVINLDLVREVEPLAQGPGGTPRCRLIFDYDHAVIVDAGASCFDGRLGPIVPAPAGYTLVVATTYQPKDGPLEERYTHLPVLAFRIVGGSDTPIPITCYGEPEDSAVYAVVLPDGKCLAGGCDVLSSLDAWKADFRADIPAGELAGAREVTL